MYISPALVLSRARKCILMLYALVLSIGYINVALCSSLEHRASVYMYELCSSLEHRASYTCILMLYALVLSRARIHV